MVKRFQVGETVIPLHELPNRLCRYQLMPQFVRHLVLDAAIAPFTKTEVDPQLALEAFCQQHQLLTPEAQAAWLQQQGMTSEHLRDAAVRQFLIGQFKQSTFGSKVESYFMKRKPALDRVMYSLIRTKDISLAQELYFRLQEGEQTFSDLATQYSQGPEAQRGGVIGPIPLSSPHPTVARILGMSQPGQLWAPFPLDEWIVIIRLEKLLSAQLDEATRNSLMEELYEEWLQKQMQKILTEMSTLVSST
ncbi:peptidylprolyl isomerase [Neosynechococcus sphagnicola sy1]|uniref:peptidylprolyl isomerase n=1 Tax=Neosynechococcus sphagnicola sy1 TaxID=1497020 RepID=A0A098TJP6_9CYAN|nr:peptidylprolyl isomerase [Neosynechococcus sphagnicola]KGF72451.1 peptidylprolyl isomerase [Neosynechococcus sphagnicola sy1]